MRLPFVLATQNPDKAREIVEIFATHTGTALGAYSIEGVAFLVDEPERLAESLSRVRPLSEAPDVEETGATLEENARIKARALADALSMLAVADDTGLEVDALDGAPGVYSARYAGEHATYADNVAKLLRELGDATSRAARFATVAIARRPDGTETLRRGEVEGRIASAPTGESGFGYDPVFVPDEGGGRTFAEMDAGEKHAISHRGRAFRALAAALTDEE
ncbi:MAG TPA: RdgB/HAM1 family non-canonical purine NTP pyrophosphatase [Acidimicrobiia bacterium]|nr:RdgB/HAM1 family non-canonical purine NTP pyrophosphatase [Acidimicrobiia bacterium]